MQNHKNKKHGFITLFFILGISFTFLTWISLGSERVFEYISMKNDFTDNRSKPHNTILCADSFINILIKSRYNLDFIDNRYSFIRNLYYKDNYLCQVKSINITENLVDKNIFFIIDDYGFEYESKNGFINFVKSFNIF